MVLLAPVAGDSSAAVTPPPMEAPAVAVANFEQIEELTAPTAEAAIVQQVSAKSQASGRRFTLVTTIGGGVIGIAIGAIALWMNQQITIAPSPLTATRERSAAPPEVEPPRIETPPVAIESPPTKAQVEEPAATAEKVDR